MSQIEVSATTTTDVADLFGEPMESPLVCRPHCARCGRYVRVASVRQVTYRDSMGLADDSWTGTCLVHGEGVDVTWDEL